LHSAGAILARMWQYTPRVAVIRGLRTPFAKSGTHYAQLSALDLGKLVVAELVQRSGVDPASVQELVFGNVIPSVKAPNIARELAPHAPAIAESATGLTMGESAEKMAKENGISREAQDKFALQSHHRAAAATENGRFKEEVMTVVVPPLFDNVVDKDNLIRGDSTPEAM